MAFQHLGWEAVCNQELMPTSPPAAAKGPHLLLVIVSVFSFHLGPEEPHPSLKMDRGFCYGLSASPLKPQVALCNQNE